MTERKEWEARHRGARDAALDAPSAWILEQCRALPHRSLILDLASGRGRHAVPLARAGHRVIALDYAWAAVARARDESDGAVLPVVADAAAIPIGPGTLDAVVCVSFLDRALLPRLRDLLRPQGRLIVETFTVEQRGHGGPQREAYLLRPGELPRLVAPMPILAQHEGLVRDDAGERYVAGVVAVNEGV
ncbi:MAG TPA: class I SAM-dependent methyltransferase [Gemmatimonadaceae bacterium]|nr:class I SAM-dependent methyltransferase [Gemmatimonadaceae bacterium]